MPSFTSLIACLALCCIAQMAIAQNDSSGNNNLNPHALQPADDFEDATIAEAWAEEIAALRLHPIDLNSTSEEQLLAIPVLTPVLARRIIARRDSIGGFRAVSELLLIDEMSRRIFFSIKPFVVTRVDSMRVDFRSRVSEVLEQEAGYRDGAFAGNALHDFQHLDARWRRWEINLLTEKDPGEASYFDHVAASLMFNDSTLRVIAGDYVVGFGQGLLSWRGLSTGKTSEVIRAPRRTALGIQPARNAAESGNYRGLAFGWDNHDANAGLFLSDTKCDASIAADGTFTTISTSGLHRTAAEIANQNTLREEVLGGHAGWQWTSGMLQAVAASTTFDHPWNHDGTTLNTILNAGINGRFNFSNADLFGECVSDAHGDQALVAGGLAHLGDDFDCAALYRNYPRRFFAIHANAFGEHSNGENEEGIYFGVRWNVNEAVTVSAYHDIFSYPFPTATIPLPSSGDESLIAISIALSDNIDLRLLGTWKQSPTAITDTTAFGDVESRVATALRRRLRFEIKFHDGIIRLRTRAELTDYRADISAPMSAGIALLADAAVKPFAGFSISTRTTFFNTASYDASVYENEDALDGIATVPTLDGAGCRAYVMCAYHFENNFMLEAKWSATYKPGAATMGSGEELINGNLEQMVEVQLRWRI